MYKCSNCQACFELAQNESVRCPSCGAKILYKVRGTIAKEVDTL